jgi:hypothetical protein
MLVRRRGLAARLNPEARLEVYGQELQRRVLRHLQGRHADQGPGIDQHQATATASPTTACPGLKRSTTCSANPPFGVDWKRRPRGQRRAREPGAWREIRRRAAAQERRLAAVPAAHALEDEAVKLRRRRRQPRRHRLQRLAAVHRRRRLRRERDPPLDHRERLAGGHRRPAGPDVLQHRHQHLHLAAHQPQAFRDAFTEVDPEAVPVIAKEHKKVELDLAVLFPGHTMPELAANELHTLLGLNPAGKGNFVEYEADSNLKDFENIPLKEDVISYVLREVRPYVADAWIDRDTLDEQDGGIGKVGFEINFNREFFQYQPPRPLAEIDAELEAVEKRIMGLLREVTA